MKESETKSCVACGGKTKEGSLPGMTWCIRCRFGLDVQAYSEMEYPLIQYHPNNKGEWQQVPNGTLLVANDERVTT